MKPANPIQVVGIKDLDEMELEAVYRIGDRYYGKLQRAVKNMASLVVHIKSYDKEGRQRKYSVHVKLVAPARIFVSTKVHDWNLEKALHKSFQDIERQSQHRLHTYSQNKKA
ncbi:hypothetical protein J4458_06165 [Candidatus Woesearchaeota archaeon]|nr:hypothetical protein [Candidatus Woesearchaeota archaeon]